MEQRSFQTHIAGLSLVRGCKFHDDRGLFEEVYNERDSPSDIRVDKLRQVLWVFSQTYDVFSSFSHFDADKCCDQ